MIGRQRRSFDGANVFITGAASGIGRATAEHAGRLGARLHLTDLSASGLSEAVSRIDWVYTSTDIRLAHLLQRVAPPLYVLLMRLINRQANRVLPEVRRARRPSEVS